MSAVLGNSEYCIYFHNAHHILFIAPSISAAFDQVRVKPPEAEQITPVCPSVCLAEETHVDKFRISAATLNGSKAQKISKPM